MSLRLLNNGQQAEAEAVRRTMFRLGTLDQESLAHAFRKAENSSHILPNGVNSRLHNQHIMTLGIIPEVTRNVILSAVSGVNGGDVSKVELIDPVKQTEPDATPATGPA